MYWLIDPDDVGRGPYRSDVLIEDAHRGETTGSRPLARGVSAVGQGATAAASNGEAARAAMFPLVFPLVFASSAFVDTSFMPGSVFGPLAVRRYRRASRAGQSSPRDGRGGAAATVTVPRWDPAPA